MQAELGDGSLQRRVRSSRSAQPRRHHQLVHVVARRVCRLCRQVDLQGQQRWPAVHPAGDLDGLRADGGTEVLAGLRQAYGMATPPRAAVVKAGAASAPAEGLALDGLEHGGALARSGAERCCPPAMDRSRT
jgi:hypothetical protein